MVGMKIGFAGILKSNGIVVLMFHCIIHQNALAYKAGIIQDCMAVAIKIVNKIKGGHKAINHRLFKTFLMEFGI